MSKVLTVEVCNINNFGECVELKLDVFLFKFSLSKVKSQ